MASLVRAARDPGYPADISLVVSNRPDASGLDIARSSKIPTVVIDHTEFQSREEFEHRLDSVLREHSIDFVCLAGFMRLLTNWFVSRWNERILNIHPALLPAFRGLHTHEHAIQKRARIHGASVHFVNSEMDAGPILSRMPIHIRANESSANLAKRVLRMEHRLYPAALKIVAEGRVKIEGDRCIVDGTPVTPYVLFAGKKRNSVSALDGPKATLLDEMWRSVAFGGRR
jgi:phosphoribosylglycinamide formyltransferase-1